MTDDTKRTFMATKQVQSMGKNLKQIAGLTLLVTLIKLLFMFTRLYHSTDFEVHRNWLAITHSLPLSQWYTESTSIWTLDYPPVFAWFSLLLSYPAVYADPHMLNVTNLNYKSDNAILYLRTTVIVSDIILVWGTKQCCDYLADGGIRKSSKWASSLLSPMFVLQVLILCNIGLLIVDHIHFQYNGILFGLLLLSIAAMLKGQHVLSAFYFAVLLNAKHIYLYVSPVYFIFLLRNACFSDHRPGLTVPIKTFRLGKFLTIAFTVLGVCVASLGPFIVSGQSQALIQRLFPFQRGLFHSYWAPNIWALYCTFDKLLEVVLRLLGFQVPHSNITTGITWDAKFSVLPNVTPSVTFLLTIVAMSPCLVKLWKSPGNALHFVRCLVLCALTAYMFGWHVHEKAILMAIVPLTVLSVLWQYEAKIFFLISITGYFSLLPLIPPGIETVIKFSLFAAHIVYLSTYFSKLFDEQAMSSWQLPFLTRLESWYVFGTFFVSLATILLPIYLPHLEFLPLLLVSAYCSVGIFYSWVKYYLYFMTQHPDNHKRKLH